MFAAGFGTRMKELTQDRPKPLIEVAGAPLIDRAHRLLTDAKCDPIAANLHYRADMLATHLAPKGVHTIEEQPQILETGGGLRNALPVLGGSEVVTLNPDAVWAGPNPVQMVQDAWQPEKMDALLMCIPPERTIGHRGQGDFFLANSGQLRRGPGVVFGGCQIIKTELLADISEDSFSINLLWDLMLEQERLFGLVYPGHWCDVGHPSGIKQAEKMLEAHHV